MFAKPYKLKSNNTLKNSEKKHLGQRIQNEFSAVTEEKIKKLIPIKSNSSCMKLILHSEEIIGVYVVDGVPVMIDLGDRLAPTVCALWKVPDLVPTISIHSPVLSKMQGGAPLYAPGVVTESIPQFRKGSVIAACTTDNSAAGAVGLATMSSADLLSTSMGVCLETLHVFNDLLCKDLKFNKIERPKQEPPSHANIQIISNDLSQLNIQPIKEEWPSLVKEEIKPAVNEPKIIAETETQEKEKENADVLVDELNCTIASENSDIDEIPQDMDGLLRWCLLSFLKMEGKNVELPLKTNLLYKNHLMKYCPPDRTLDVKKSHFKKMSKFLEAMEREGLIQVRDIDKGVSALTALCAAHPAVRAHAPAAPVAVAPTAPSAPDLGDDYEPPQIRELYCVTANVAELFAPLKKGAALSGGDVREQLRRRVQQRGLQAAAGVRLDDALARAAGAQPQETMRWEEVWARVTSRMTPATEVRFAGETRLLKSRLEPVRFQLVTRSGNKKVTLVSNLESYGFALAPLARACQQRAGAACGVTRAAGARADQLALQGDQTHFMAKLLIEKFGLPKKFVEGADKALNKKK